MQSTILGGQPWQEKPGVENGRAQRQARATFCNKTNKLLYTPVMDIRNPRDGVPLQPHKVQDLPNRVEHKQYRKPHHQINQSLSTKHQRETSRERLAVQAYRPVVTRLGSTRCKASPRTESNQPPSTPVLKSFTAIKTKLNRN